MVNHPPTHSSVWPNNAEISSHPELYLLRTEKHSQILYIKNIYIICIFMYVFEINIYIYYNLYPRRQIFRHGASGYVYMYTIYVYICKYM